VDLIFSPRIDHWLLFVAFEEIAENHSEKEVGAYHKPAESIHHTLDLGIKSCQKSQKIVDKERNDDGFSYISFFSSISPKKS
jgi:hypothetical protein